MVTTFMFMMTKTSVSMMAAMMTMHRLRSPLYEEGEDIDVGEGIDNNVEEIDVDTANDDDH